MDAKYLKTCMKFVLVYSLTKNDVNLQKKNHEPSWCTRTRRASFLLQQLSSMVNTSSGILNVSWFPLHFLYYKNNFESAKL